MHQNVCRPTSDIGSRGWEIGRAAKMMAEISIPQEVGHPPPE